MTGAPAVAAVATTLILALTPAHADKRWPSFLNGGTGQTHAAKIPTSWEPDRNIAWGAPIPGYGQSAPVIWDGRIFVTSSDGPWQERGMVHAYDLATGSRLWTSEVPATTKVENYFRNSRAAPSPVVDKDRVLSLFPGGDLTAMDHDGKILWSQPLFQKLGQPVNERGTAGSLAQSADHVFLVVDHEGPSYALAVRKSDGEIAWKVDRGEREASWSSPILVRHGGNESLVISSANTVEAYHARTGERAWKADGFQGNLIPSLTAVDGSLFVGSTKMFHGDQDTETVAASNCRMDLNDGTAGAEPFTIRWGAEKANSYYSSPLAFAGYVYYVNKSGVLYAIDAETGQRRFTQRLGKPSWASAIGVTDPDGESLVYFFLKDGDTVVLRPGDSYDEISRNKFWGAAQRMTADDDAKRQRQDNKVPTDEAGPKTGPDKLLGGLPEKALHGIFSYGDPTVYAAAVVDHNLVIRTGQQLICVRQR